MCHQLEKIWIMMSPQDKKRCKYKYVNVGNYES